ncbi:MAG: aldehyde ferredoxin oxidoreductase [Desulfurococcales archaeon]|nr:aldehyde ferredoxin oxidoreductase [Desulfurococcales archaeon]
MGLGLRLLRVDVGSGEWGVEEVDGLLGPLDLGVTLHLGEYSSYRYDAYSERNAVVLGWGPFAHSRLLGSHRVVAVFRSPLTGGLHASTMGGAAWVWARSGLDALAVEGRAEEPSLLLVEGGPGGEVRVRVAPLEARLGDLWRPRPGGLYGARLLQEAAEAQARRLASTAALRVAVVGPAAEASHAGALQSWEHGWRVVDGASRGGVGSVLLRAHGVAAIAVGGRLEPPRRERLAAYRAAEEAARERVGAPLARAVLGTTRKYRFDERLGTGGTFGVNYVHYRELVPMLAFNTIYYNVTVRLRLHAMLMERFWGPFQAEVFSGSPAGKWLTCGEPCPVACKKVYRGVKVDYEPFHALGPMVGVFELDHARRLVEHADALGVDAIEAGHAAAWLLDLASRGIIDPASIGASGRPVMEPDRYKPEHSGAHAGAVEKVLLAAYHPEPPGELGGLEPAVLAGRHGIRAAARELESRGASGAGDWAVYAAFGHGGWYMTPNLYWTPGMIAPLYMLGRYWTNYTPTFQEPEDYARTSLQRAAAEYAVDNAGFCRFHRGWVEKVLDRLYEALGASVDPIGNARRMYRLVADYRERAGAQPVPWETRKTMDILATIAAEMGAGGWAERLAGDPGAALEWWERFHAEVRRLLEAW